MDSLFEFFRYKWFLFEKKVFHVFNSDLMANDLTMAIRHHPDRFYPAVLKGLHFSRRSEIKREIDTLFRHTPLSERIDEKIVLAILQKMIDLDEIDEAYSYACFLGTMDRNNPFNILTANKNNLFYVQEIEAEMIEVFKKHREETNDSEVQGGFYTMERDRDGIQIGRTGIGEGQRIEEALINVRSINASRIYTGITNMGAVSGIDFNGNIIDSDGERVFENVGTSTIQQGYSQQGYSPGVLDENSVGYMTGGQGRRNITAGQRQYSVDENIFESSELNFDTDFYSARFTLGSNIKNFDSWEYETTVVLNGFQVKKKHFDNFLRSTQRNFQKKFEIFLCVDEVRESSNPIFVSIVSEIHPNQRIKPYCEKDVGLTNSDYQHQLLKDPFQSSPLSEKPMTKQKVKDYLKDFQAFTHDKINSSPLLEMKDRRQFERRYKDLLAQFKPSYLSDEDHAWCKKEAYIIPMDTKMTVGESEIDIKMINVVFCYNNNHIILMQDILTKKESYLELGIEPLKSPQSI